ncbi:MAG: hypothetical protein KAX99_06500 [Azonexus sp.]|nr:hypothetical protein [Azonexus sp.]
MNYFSRVAIAVDQLVATVFFGTLPDETISAMARRRRWKRTEAFINWIFNDDLHCARAYIAELSRSQISPDYKE